MSSVAIRSRLRDLHAQRDTLQQRIDNLEAEAEAAGNRGRMDRYVPLRQRLRVLHRHLSATRADIARFEHVEPPLPSRRQSELVER